MSVNKNFSLQEDIDHIKKFKDTTFESYHRKQLNHASECIIKRLRSSLWFESDFKNKKLVFHDIKVNVDDCINSGLDKGDVESDIAKRFNDHGINVSLYRGQIPVDFGRMDDYEYDGQLTKEGFVAKMIFIPKD